MNVKLSTYEIVESMIMDVVKWVKEENATKEYWMTPNQRNVAHKFSEMGFASMDEVKKNIEKTLDEGFFNTSFNTEEKAIEFMRNLQEITGKQHFELRKVKVAENTTIPGFSFMGQSVKGDIYETRLFYIG